MNGTDLELRKELWMWRGVAIILLLMMLSVNVITFLIDRDQHAKDNQERAQAWTTILDNQRSIKVMVLKNHEAILKAQDSVTSCASCHTHHEGPPK